MQFLGLIPARGGSKSIPDKNIVSLLGKPLIAYTGEAACCCKKLTKVVVSTDDEKIATVCRNIGLEVPFMRPRDLAEDETPMLPVITHALEFYKKTENWVPDAIVLLQPTSPLRRAEHIDGACELLEKSGADSVVSIIEVPHQFNPVSVMNFENGRLTPYKEGRLLLRRQDKPKVYARNGPAVLAVRTATILKKKSLYGGDVCGFIMKSEESIDIDTPLDLEIAEFLLTRRK